MYILASDQKSVIDSGYVQRFCLVEKPDATLIIASYSADRAITIGKYADAEEGHGVLAELYAALAAGAESYDKSADWARNYWPHCPNCGAKMRGGG